MFYGSTAYGSIELGGLRGVMATVAISILGMARMRSVSNIEVLAMDFATDDGFRMRPDPYQLLPMDDNVMS